MQKNTDPRHTSRIFALQKLFEGHFKSTKLAGRKTQGLNSDTLQEINKAEDYDKKLYKKIIGAVQKGKDRIDKIITSLAPKRPIDQMSPLDLQILRIAIAEGFIENFTPHKVAIDEAIELAKEFSGATSSKFVNGVLGTLLSKRGDFNLQVKLKSTS